MTTAAELLPPIPQPPHDPTSLRLDGVLGWSAASLSDVEIAAPDGVLQLAAVVGTGPALTDSSGSFGGLALPTGVAVTPDGRIFAVDRKVGGLVGFDACACAFMPVFCRAGATSAGVALNDPHGLAADGRYLFLADSGNHRVLVISTRSFAVTKVLNVLPSASVQLPWTPWDVAVDSRGGVWVTDPANGAIHHFDSEGRLRATLSGHGAVRDLAVDRCGRLYVTIDGIEPAVLRLQGDFTAVDRPTKVGEVAEEFVPLPFEVDAAGRLHLGAFCSPEACPDSPGVDRLFDAQGAPVPNVPAVVPIMHAASGVYLSRPLDSEIYRCQWHRVTICGEIPRGAALSIATFSAEAEFSDGQIALLSDANWQPAGILRGLERSGRNAGQTDALVQSGPGRYLWLRLTLLGNQRATPALTRVTVEFPRISLRRMLPAVYSSDPVAADFTDRYLSLFDTTLRGIENGIDHIAELFDPASAPTGTNESGRGAGTGDFLTWLASWIGVSLDRSWPEAKRRLWLKNSARLFALRGTREGLRQQLLLFFGIEPAATATTCADCEPAPRCPPPPDPCAAAELPGWQAPGLLLEHFRLRRWMFLGAGRLGDEAQLWGRTIVNRTQLGRGGQVGASQLVSTPDPVRDPFHVYAHRFTVFAPASCVRTESHRKSLDRLLRAESPAHTAWDVRYVEPRFRIGVQAMIGIDAVVGRLPQGVTLGGTAPLGQGTVLTGPEGARHASLQVGASARIGSSTKLAMG